MGVLASDNFAHKLQAVLSDLFTENGWPATIVVPLKDALLAGFSGRSEERILASTFDEFYAVVSSLQAMEELTGRQLRALHTGMLAYIRQPPVTPSSSAATTSSNVSRRDAMQQ